jgi:hypothetical protein
MTQEETKDTAVLDTVDDSTNDDSDAIALTQMAFGNGNVDAPEGPDTTDTSEATPSDADQPADEATPSGDAGEFTPTDKQIAAAKHLKYSDEEIAGMTEADFKAAVQASGRLRSQEKARGNQSPQVEDSDPETPAPSDLEARLADVDKVLKTIEGDDWDYEDVPDMMGNMAKMVKTMAAEIQSLRGNTSEARKSQRVTEGLAFINDLDQRTWSPIFGKSAELTEFSPEKKVRQELYDLAGSLQDAASKQGRDVSYKQALDMALQTLHPERYNKPKSPLRTPSARPTGAATRAGGAVSDANADAMALTQIAGQAGLLQG